VNLKSAATFSRYRFPPGTLSFGPPFNPVLESTQELSMGTFDIVLYPDDPLTTKAEPYTDAEFGPQLPQLAEDMLETMRALEGVGLAGPQIGLSKRIFVMREPEGDAMCLINPEILESEGREEGEEGCLSMPRMYSLLVPRASWIKVKARNITGEHIEFEATDFLARIIQHELDHLDGLMFFERLDIISRETVLQEWAEVRKQLTQASQPQTS
jgi:peptide deformylase